MLNANNAGARSMFFGKIYMSPSYCRKRNYVGKRKFFLSLRLSNVYYKGQPSRKIYFFAVAHRLEEIIKRRALVSPFRFQFFRRRLSEGASRRPTPTAPHALTNVPARGHENRRNARDPHHDRCRSRTAGERRYPRRVSKSIFSPFLQR